MALLQKLLLTLLTCMCKLVVLEELLIVTGEPFLSSSHQ